MSFPSLHPSPIANTLSGAAGWGRARPRGAPPGHSRTARRSVPPGATAPRCQSEWRLVFHPPHHRPAPFGTNPSVASRRLRRAAGFTLIELLMAMAILSLMLVALFTFVFSMGEIWGRGSEQRLFAQHVSASARHVESLLRRGAAPLPGGTAGTEPFAVRSIRTPDSGTVDLLSFTLPAGDRLLNWPGPALPDVTCSLGLVPNRGLVLYWQSALEINQATEPPRVATISRFVTNFEYLNYAEDTDTWRSDTRLQKGSDGKWRLPDRLRLTYTYGSLTAVREISLPALAGPLPAD